MPGWCPPRLTGLMVGAADMAADLGAETAWEPLSSLQPSDRRGAPLL
jgi:hypothetical protein